MPKTDDRIPLQLNNVQRFGDPVAAGVKIRGGALVALDTEGNAVPATAASPVLRGIAMIWVDSTDIPAGALTIETSRGVWIVGNDGTVNRTHIGKNVFVKDDAGVAATGTLVAGKCLDVLPGGVAVEIL